MALSTRTFHLLYIVDGTGRPCWRDTVGPYSQWCPFVLFIVFAFMQGQLFFYKSKHEWHLGFMIHFTNLNFMASLFFPSATFVFISPHAFVYSVFSGLSLFCIVLLLVENLYKQKTNKNCLSRNIFESVG